MDDAEAKASAVLGVKVIGAIGDLGWLAANGNPKCSGPTRGQVRLKPYPHGGCGR